jgi:glycosyltransferase involved in cell wall biosynthesis
VYRCAVLVCNSNVAARELRRRFPRAARTVVVSNGVPLPDLAQRGEARDAARVALGIAPDTPVVGIVARQVVQKRIDVFLHSIDILRQFQPQLVAVVVGSGPERESLERLTRQLGCAGVVRFTGERHDAQSLMPAFDVLCLSSDTEGAPNVLLEAAAWGLPVVSTAVGGVSEVVQDGVTGHLVAPAESTAMAARLHELLEAPDRRKAMGKAAAAHVRASYSVPVMVGAYERLYLEVMGVHAVPDAGVLA